MWQFIFKFIVKVSYLHIEKLGEGCQFVVCYSESALITFSYEIFKFFLFRFILLLGVISK